MTEGEKKKFRTEKRAPEGGYGYIVAAGMSIPIWSVTSIVPCFGLMFNDFLISVGGKTSSVTTIVGFLFTAVSFAGLFTNTLFQKFSIRSIGLFGAILYILGSFMTIFVTSVEQLMIAFIVFQGVGFGFMIVVVFTTFNSYFIERRNNMMSVSYSFIGIGCSIFPLMINFLMTEYGFRGTMAIVAALNSNVIFAMFAMHPVEWHFKIRTIPLEEETKSLVDANNEEKKRNEEVELKIVVTEKVPGMTDISADIENENQLNVPIEESARKVVMSETISVKKERSKSLDVTEIEEFHPNRRVSSITSLGNWVGASNEPTSQKNGKWQKVVDFLDLTLLKDSIYVNITLGISLAYHADTAFFALQPTYMKELGFTEPETAQIVAIGSVADLASRIALVVLTAYIHTSARNVFWAGAIFTVILRIVFLGISDFYGMAIITASLGFLKTWFHVPVSLVFAEYLPPEKFPSGYGLFQFIQGIVSFLMGSFISWLREYTHSYIMCINSLTFFTGLCAFPWIIENVWIRIKNKNEGKTHNQ